MWVCVCKATSVPLAWLFSYLFLIKPHLPKHFLSLTKQGLNVKNLQGVVCQFVTMQEVIWMRVLMTWSVLFVTNRFTLVRNFVWRTYVCMCNFFGWLCVQGSVCLCVCAFVSADTLVQNPCSVLGALSPWGLILTIWHGTWHIIKPQRLYHNKQTSTQKSNMVWYRTTPPLVFGI